ncbi:hypothetical protein M2322_003695 [Rhodoblastus acidophilus]|uniref:hypothetical protein n=1 Tax=Rhodoblastus acidophilus TaxID=1074 RepID=UPI002224AED5|nr:hypothetical protein [Rhodoblastus acidophilus]MCW2318128.1 hypothetical protein [Rhodoblastus acidophilus]
MVPPELAFMCSCADARPGWAFLFGADHVAARRRWELNQARHVSGPIAKFELLEAAAMMTRDVEPILRAYERICPACKRLPLSLHFARCRASGSLGFVRNAHENIYARDNDPDRPTGRGMVTKSGTT